MYDVLQSPMICGTIEFFLPHVLLVSFKHYSIDLVFCFLFFVFCFCFFVVADIHSGYWFDALAQYIAKAHVSVGAVIFCFYLPYLYCTLQGCNVPVMHCKVMYLL